MTSFANVVSAKMIESFTTDPSLFHIGGNNELMMVPSITEHP
jgi:hypothetical protein